jgi:hypothetical protein
MILVKVFCVQPIIDTAVSHILNAGIRNRANALFQIDCLESHDFAGV